MAGGDTGDEALSCSGDLLGGGDLLLLGGDLLGGGDTVELLLDMFNK